MIHLGILEDLDSVRNGYLRYFAMLDSIEVVLESPSVEIMEEKIEHCAKLNVMICDIGLPGKSGFEGMRIIKDRFPDCQIIMITVYNDSDRIFKALCSGASGYLLKNTPLPKVLEAITQVHNGGSSMSPSIARKVIEYFAPSQPTKKSPLTSRELQMVQGLVDGLSYKMIADRYSIGFETVKQHIKNIYRKLAVNSKAEVISKSLKGEIN